MATTGNTTLIAVVLTPRVLVSAWLGGVGALLECSAGSAAPADPDPPGEPEGAKISQATKPTTMAITMSAVRTCLARGRRRKRRHDRPRGAQGCQTPRCAGTSMLASIVTLPRCVPSCRHSYRPYRPYRLCVRLPP